jgi:hypothetical protein
MYTCVIVDGILYFINLTILKKIGFMKKTEEVSGGVSDSVPGVNAVAHAVEKVEKSIKKMGGSDVLDAIKLMGVELFLKSEWGIKSTAWTSAKIGGDNLKNLDMNNYEMTLISGNDLNKILIDVVGLTVIDILAGSKLSMKRTIRRLLALAPIPKEKELIGYQCPCSGDKCPCKGESCKPQGKKTGFY